jgi:hypothetical protein
MLYWFFRTANRISPVLTIVDGLASRTVRSGRFEDLEWLFAADAGNRISQILKPLVGVFVNRCFCSSGVVDDGKLTRVSGFCQLI